VSGKRIKPDATLFSRSESPTLAKCSPRNEAKTMSDQSCVISGVVTAARFGALLFYFASTACCAPKGDDRPLSVSLVVIDSGIYTGDSLPYMISSANVRILDGGAEMPDPTPVVQFSVSQESMISEGDTLVLEVTRDRTVGSPRAVGLISPP